MWVLSHLIGEDENGFAHLPTATLCVIFCALSAKGAVWAETPLDDTTGASKVQLNCGTERCRVLIRGGSRGLVKAGAGARAGFVAN